MVLDRYNFVLKNYSDSFEFQKMNISKEQICHILQFYFDKEEHPRQATENVNRVNGCDTVPANHSLVQFHPFRSAKFDVEDVPRSRWKVEQFSNSNDCQVKIYGKESL